MLLDDQICTLSEPAPADADQLRGLERRRLVEQLLLLRGQGKSYADCAKELGSSAPTLCRLEAAWRAEGEAGLETKHGNAGRKRKSGCLTAAEIVLAKRIYLRTESYPLAFEHLADSAICTPATRELLNQYRDSRDYPPSIRAAVHVTEEVKDRYKGPKTAQGTVYTMSRGMFIRDEEGKDHEIRAGDLWEQDDVSVDVPYYVQLPDGSFRVGRQVLVCQDLRSGQYKGACAVARPRDSYRAEDILRFNRWLVESHGLPRFLRLERGTWESDAVRGIDIGDGRRWGGLDQLIPTQHMFTSNGKAIEGGFRLLHKVLGLYGVRIGKSRGEYEQPSADMLAVNDGRKHPDACGFIPWTQLLDKFEGAFRTINERVRFDRVTGEKIAPDDLWWRDMQDRPGKRLQACPPELFYHFLPVKSLVTLGAVRAGQVQVTVPGYAKPFRFRCAGEGIPYLERGHKLFVCFDPHTAAEGAIVFNADLTVRGSSHKYLERLFTAPLAEERPQMDFSGTARQNPEIQAKRTREAQVRTAFTSIGLYGQGARRVQQDHDGAGNVGRLESGAPPRSRAASAPSVPAERTAPAPVARRSRTAAPTLIDEDFSSPVEPPPSRVATPSEAPLVEEW